jgi:transcription-repair coupling factor (superfamily II helicase)
VLLPASEGFTVPGEDLRTARRILPEGPLWTVFDLVPDAALAIIEGFEQRITDWLALVQDGYRIALSSVRQGMQAPQEPEQLYLRAEEIEAALGARQPTRVNLLGQPDEPALSLAAAARLATQSQSEGDAAVLCSDLALPRFQAMLARRLRAEVETITPLSDWKAALGLRPGQIGVMSLPLRYGFRLPGRTVLAVQNTRPTQASARLEDLIERLRLGDLVVEPERGLAQLTDLVMEDQAGAAFECLSLCFRGGTHLLVPAIEADRVWRYGASTSFAPDRLEGSDWQQRLAQTQREIETTAAKLLAQMRERLQQPAPVIEATQSYSRFVRAMPFAPTADQALAIRAVQQDLAAAHPMLRLVCGDVGFGKTEVALHAAALTALAGFQVAIAAPTTLLARQHLDVCR